MQVRKVEVEERQDGHVGRTSTDEALRTVRHRHVDTVKDGFLVRVEDVDAREGSDGGDVVDALEGRLRRRVVVEGSGREKTCANASCLVRAR